MNVALARDSNPSRFGLLPRPSMLEKALGFVSRIALWPAHVVAARRMLGQLSGLSEYELRDIGLTRQDLVDLTARPLDEDPTPHLNRARISRARRA